MTSEDANADADIRLMDELRRKDETPIIHLVTRYSVESLSLACPHVNTIVPV
ncbi:MAG: hypothetical protein ACRD8Z_13705 [Nitrososphaeraceae archaeon]